LLHTWDLGLELVLPTGECPDPRGIQHLNGAVGRARYLSVTSAEQAAHLNQTVENVSLKPLYLCA